MPKDWLVHGLADGPHMRCAWQHMDASVQASWQSLLLDPCNMFCAKILSGLDTDPADITDQDPPSHQDNE